MEPGRNSKPFEKKTKRKFKFHSALFIGKYIKEPLTIPRIKTRVLYGICDDKAKHIKIVQRQRNGE